jgi:tRNA (cmo5U34)-methyltransferase
MTKPKKDFSFKDHAREFDAHIEASIPGYQEFKRECVALSSRFIQSRTRVVDIGCSMGSLLSAIERANRSARPGVEYVGIDVEPEFGHYWPQAANLRFEVADAMTFQGMDNMSLALGCFVVQFVRPADKIPLLKRIHAGLVDGGALVITEKTLASSSRIQDAMTFRYYDEKVRRGFSPAQILNKERALRGHMTLWEEPELKSALNNAGFREVEPIWRSHFFVGLLALK